MKPLRFGRWGNYPATEKDFDFDTKLELSAADLVALQGDGPEIDPNDIPLFDKIQWVRGRV